MTSPKLIKMVRMTISKQFAIIANSSFSLGVFPDKLKFAKVTPIHKGKSKLELGNYRPISILPIFSKVLEQLMNICISKFFNKHRIIFQHQYGFQGSRSTFLAILSLQSQLINNLEKKPIYLLLIFDFSKAFDTVNLVILLQKLECYSFRGIPFYCHRSILFQYLKAMFFSYLHAAGAGGQA